MTAPSAKVVADSVSPAGDRLTTFEVTMHRWELPSLNTHRVLSRNSASSRAIPVAKQLARVIEDPAMPIEWGSNQPGMQAGEALSEADAAAAGWDWLEARDHMVRIARRLADRGVHKQITNRLLEPFMWHTVIVSGTDWTGFWEQRCSPLAQPEIRAAAEAMWAAYEVSEPVERPWEVWSGRFTEHRGSPVSWHLPYVTDRERADLGISSLLKLSTARCARVSYLTHDGVRDLDADYTLFDRLVTARPGHWSPLEHCARPDDTGRAPGNFTGWAQLRHMVELFGWRP